MRELKRTGYMSYTSPIKFGLLDVRGSALPHSPSLSRRADFKQAVAVKEVLAGNFDALRKLAAWEDRHEYRAPPMNADDLGVTAGETAPDSYACCLICWDLPAVNRLAPVSGSSRMSITTTGGTMELIIYWIAFSLVASIAVGFFIEAGER